MKLKWTKVVTYISLGNHLQRFTNRESIRDIFQRKIRFGIWVNLWDIYIHHSQVKPMLVKTKQKRTFLLLGICYKTSTTMIDLILGKMCSTLKAHSKVRQFLISGISIKMMKNAFYFTLKALFFLKIFRFLSWLFGHVEKTARLER